MCVHNFQFDICRNILSLACSAAFTFGALARSQIVHEMSAAAEVLWRLKTHTNSLASQSVVVGTGIDETVNRDTYTHNDTDKICSCR